MEVYQAKITSRTLGVQNEINSVKEETNNKIGMDDQEERKGVEAISAFEQQHAQALKLKNLSTLETGNLYILYLLVREIAEMQVEVLCKFCKNYYLVPVHRKALSSSLLRCGIIWTVCCLGWIFCCFCKENVTFCPHCQRALDGKSYFLQD